MNQPLPIPLPWEMGKSLPLGGDLEEAVGLKSLPLGGDLEEALRGA